VTAFLGWGRILRGLKTGLLRFCNDRGTQFTSTHVDWPSTAPTVLVNGKLTQQNQNEQALRILDVAIAMAINENEHRWVLTLSHHAAVISNFLRNFSREKHYYEKSLEFNPENPIALYGLAEVALEQGDADLAKQFAKRSYDATVQGDDETAKHGLLDLIAMKWPDIASK
jgi:tetratricopeptide (TPR) repeat protein